MKNHPPKLSIIIVNWNAKKFLKICLESIKKEMHHSHEIIVVDNNSEDGSQQMVKRYFPQVILVANKKNLGFSRANNQALAIAQGEYVLFLNPDTKIEDQAIERSINFIDKNPKIGLVGVRLIAENGETQLSSGRRLPSIWGEFVGFFLRNPFPQTRIFGSYLMSWWDHKDRRGVEAICGAYMLARKKTMAKLKGLDEEYFMYGEDVDLCARVKKMGLKVYFLGDISITH
ncbi:glycosyltransferase family 2 protein, partial [Patescibacteria group bacterium]|nr:glycosyltransferase family 2 protein [Patescibacteria group bacterium]